MWLEPGTREDTGMKIVKTIYISILIGGIIVTGLIWLLACSTTEIEGRVLNKAKTEPKCIVSSNSLITPTGGAIVIPVISCEKIKYEVFIKNNKDEQVCTLTKEEWDKTKLGTIIRCNVRGH